MRDISKYRGIIPAFYACYDDKGDISEERTKAWAKYMLDAGVKGLYVCGSSGECIYQGVEDRKRTLQAVMDAVGGKLTVIAHVACNNTADSVVLAKHAQSLGVDAIHRQVLERHLRRRAGHGFRHLQYPPACGGGSDHAAV